MTELNIEQRFQLTRARYECSKMSRPALEKTCLRLLKSRMELKTNIQTMLMDNGIVFKIDEVSSGLPEIISEDTFCELLIMNSEEDDEMPTDINDPGYEFDDLDDDDLTFV
jgi:hypothetical protein